MSTLLELVQDELLRSLALLDAQVASYSFARPDGPIDVKTRAFVVRLDYDAWRPEVLVGATHDAEWFSLNEVLWCLAIDLRVPRKAWPEILRWLRPVLANNAGLLTELFAQGEWRLNKQRLFAARRTYNAQPISRRLPNEEL